MAFTEFTCRSGGSNLNAGTLDGSAEGATTPLVAVTSGSWDSSSLNATMPVGTDMSPFAVGQFIAAYLDGDTVPTTNRYFIARIGSVTPATRLLQLNPRTALGAMFGTTALGVSFRLGGAWAGPSGAVGFPFTLSGTLIGDVAADPPRVNCKNDQQYNVTTNLGPTPSMAVQGYTNTFGDGGKATFDGGSPSATFTIFSPAANTILRDLILQNNGTTTGNSPLATGGSGRQWWDRLVFKNCRANALTMAGGNALLTECEFYNCATAGGQTVLELQGSVTLVRCVVHDCPNATAAFALSGSSCRAIDCIAKNNGGIGFSLNSGNTQVIVQGCDAYGNTSHGISVTSTGLMVLIENCNLVKNGGYGINQSGSTLNMVLVRNCGFGSGTMVNTSGTINGNVDSSGNVTYASGVTPWVDPANGDFRINLAAARGAGRGAYTQTQTGMSGTVGYPDIGAAQHLEAAPPAVGDVRLGVSYNYGLSTGTLALPAVSNVRNNIGYGADGVEFTGNVVLPATTNVKSNIGYGSFNGTFYEFAGNVTLPVASKVTQSTQYGANGTEFTGTVSLPAVSKVRLGLQYGASGTQFTGTDALPPADKVDLGYQYGGGGTEFTGSLVSATDYPATGVVRSGVAYNFGTMIGTYGLPDLPAGTPGRFLHLPHRIVAKLLVDRGICTDKAFWSSRSKTAADDPTGAHDWPAYAGDEPDQPDNCVTVYRSADQLDGRVLSTGQNLKHPGIQIKVRGRTDDLAGLKAEALEDDLTKYATDQTVVMTDPPATYLIQSFPVVRLTSAYRAAPGSNRWAYSLNCLVVITPYPTQG